MRNLPPVLNIAVPAILWRYILREVALYTLLGLAALALLFVAANLLKDLELLQVVGGDPHILARLLLVILPAYLTYVVPAALLCGVLLALSRMSADGEIIAMRASGLGLGALLPPVAALGVASVAITAFVSFELEPRSHHELKLLRRELLSTHSIITPGRVRPLGTGRTLYVAETGNAGCPLKGVVISDFRERERPYYVAATCGSVVDLDTQGVVALDLLKGAVHISHLGADRYDRIEFARSQVEVDLDELEFFRKRLSHYRFDELLADAKAGDYPPVRVRTEIHRRLAFPLCGLLLALLAIPLGIRPVRRGRSAGTLVAVAVMALYWCVFTAAQLAADGGLVPPWSLWLPNAAVLVLAAALLRRHGRGEA
jgi:lipopolysaccharide export system permease protein